MRRWALLASVAAVGTLGACFVAGAEDARPQAARSLLINVRILERDCSGAREGGVQKVLAEPTLVVVPNRPFSFAVGGQVRIPGTSQTVQYGTKLDGKADPPRDGRVRMDLLLSTSALVESSSERLHLRAESHHIVRAFELGKRTTIPASADGSSKDAWIELLVEALPQESL